MNVPAEGLGERFLADGAERVAACGSPAGRERVAIDLPGGPYAVVGLSPAHVAALASRFRDRCRGGGAAVAPVEAAVLAAPARAFRRVDTRGWEYVLDLEAAKDGLRVAGLGLFAAVELGPPVRARLWVAADDEPSFAGACENLLRVLVAYRMLDLGGALVHAAGAAVGSRAVVAVGRSGAGKSTFARAASAAGAVVLSDDLVALLPGSGRPVVAPLPFTGDLPPAPAATAAAEIAALLRLEQAPTDELRPLGRAEALATLLACAPVVNVDPFRRERLLTVLGDLLAAAGNVAWALRCTPAGGWPLAARLLEAGAGAPP